MIENAIMEYNNKVSEKVKYFSRLAVNKNINVIDKSIILTAKPQEESIIQKEETVKKFVKNLTDLTKNSIFQESYKNKENIYFNLNLLNDQQITQKWNLNKFNPLKMLSRKVKEICLKITEKVYISEAFDYEEEVKVIGYFEIKFKSFVVYKFGKEERSYFKKVQFFSEPELTLDYVILVCKSVKGWIEMNPECVFIFEKADNQFNFTFLISCIVKMLNPLENLTNITKKFDTNSTNFILKRHLKNFIDILDNKLPAKKQQLLFYQLIFAAKTGNLESFSKEDFVLKIISEEKIYEFFSNKEPNYKDEFYLIFFLKEIPIKGEVKIILLSENKKIFELNFNSFFYESGILRLREEEIDFINSQKDASIWLDLAFKENKLMSLHVPYNLNFNTIENLQIICDYFNRSVNLEDLKELMKQYNKIFAKFVLLQENSLVNSKKFIETLPARLDNKFKLPRMNSSQSKQPNNFSFENKKIENIKNSLEILTINPRNDEKDIYEINYLDDEDDYHNETLEILTNTHFEEENINPKISVKRAPPLQKKKQEEIPTVFARKPLHLTGMVSRDSIFNDLANLQVNYDVNKFEEWFCEPVFKKEEAPPPKENNSVLDQSKVFLAQLAVKNLEKSGLKIKYTDFEYILLNKFDFLRIEDLKNMQKLFLKEEEILKLQNYSLEKIDPLEKQIIKYSKNSLLKNVLFILLFDKKISEEFYILKKVLNSYKINFKNLLENEGLKLILKLALELSNAVNYKYTLNKKRVMTFRMSSLKSLQNYKGKTKDQNLLTFLVNQLKNKKEKLIQEINLLSEIQSLKEINLEEIKERINEFIIEHRECTKKINFIEENLEIKKHLKRMLSRAYKFLKGISDDFTQVGILTHKVRNKFCDYKEESIKSVISDLCVFFRDLKNELEKCK